jgi:TetR/AcrR family transcriptional regulator, tetracycline repressor protein
VPGSDERTRRRPGNRAGLDADRVLRAARDITLQGGAEALTMRRLASNLGVAPNALYSHYPDKSALLDAVLDSLLSAVEVTELDETDWQTGLVGLMTASRRMLLDHADLLPQLMSRPMRGRNASRLGEATLALLERGAIKGPEAVTALRSLLTYTFGSVVIDAPRRADPDPAQRTAESVAAFSSRSEEARVARLAVPLSKPPSDADFEVGLRWLIDGMARNRARRR